jgi:peptidoglycan-associated lipoprotein
MSIRLLPALCAGLMLAACADGSGPPGAKPPENAPTVSRPLATTPDFDMDKYFVNEIDTVYFDVDSSTLTARALPLLQRQTAFLSADPRRTITIEGHADERGTREYNLALGERRAQAVMSYLIALGVDPKRLKTISYGKERPTCTEANEACWSRNRRAVSALDPL